MKEPVKNPLDETNDEEIASLPEKQFREMRVKIPKILEIEWRKYKKYLTRTQKN